MSHFCDKSLFPEYNCLLFKVTVRELDGPAPQVQHKVTEY